MKDSFDIDVDLLENPDKAADPQIAAKIFAYGMKKGSYTGRKLADYNRSDGTYDFVNARRIVNGTDRARLFANTAQEYYKVLIELDFG